MASAFGRSIDVQRGEADELTEAVKSIFVLFQEGQKMSLDMILMLYSMSNAHSILYTVTANLSYMPGHFSYSWCMSIMRFAVENSKAGRKSHKLEELIFTLIKARRESDNPEKVRVV